MWMEPERAHKDEKYNQVVQVYPLTEDPSSYGLTSWWRAGFSINYGKLENMAERNMAMTDRKDSISIKNLPSDLREK